MVKRSTSRGRVYPQSYSTDRRIGRLGLHALALFPLLWANGDDQGRLSGDTEEVKYAVCPNVDHLTKENIPDTLAELEKNELIKCYTASKLKIIQLLDWWDVHRKPQWAWPSDYPPPDGWPDHLRYKLSAQEVYTRNWPPPAIELPFKPPSGESSGEGSGEGSGEEAKAPTPHKSLKRKHEDEDEDESHLRPQVRKSSSSLSKTREFSDILRIYEREKMGAVTPVIEEELRAAVEKYPINWVWDAIKEASKSGGDKRNLRYVAGILENWKREGRGEDYGGEFVTVNEGELEPDPAAVEIWGKAKAALEKLVSRSYYRTWLDKTQGIGYVDSVFHVGVPNDFAAHYLSQNQRSLILKVLIDLTQSDVKVDFVVVRGVEAKGGDV